MNKTIWAIVVIIIIVIGGWFIYNSTQTTTTAPADTSAVTTTTDTTAVSHDNIYLSATDPTKGSYMTDFAGKALYTFDKDSVGTTTCYGGCATTWPPYTSGAAAQGALPANISLITRTDGTQQFAWNGMPLYYYQKDTAPNQINGDGVGGTWHIIKM